MSLEAPNDEVARLRSTKARELDALAHRTGEPVFSRAAAILRGGRSGRRTIDDSRALAMVEGLVRQGIAASIHEACETVATLVTQPCLPHQVRATRDRLRRKVRTKYYDRTLPGNREVASAQNRNGEPSQCPDA